MSSDPTPWRRQSSQISGSGSPATPGSAGLGDTSTGPPPPPAFPSSGVPPPPPPPPVPGSVPTVRLNSEIPDSRGKGFPPAAIQTAMMTKDKKPFTYTPGGIDLSEIRSPRMARRITRNAMAEGITSEPRPSNLTQSSGPTPPTPPHTLPPQALAAMQPQIAIPVFPQGLPVNQMPTPPPPPGGRGVPASPQTPRPTSVPPSPQTSKPSPVPSSPQQIRPSSVPAFSQTQKPSPIPASPGPEGPRFISPNVSKVSPQPPPTPPTPGPQYRNEPGSIYVPPVAPAPSGRPNAQLGSIYIPPVPTQQQQQQQQQVTPGTPGSPVYTQLNKAPVPWMNSQARHQQQQQTQLPPYVHPPQQVPVAPAGPPPWQQPQKQGPQTRIIPIQVEGRPTPVQPRQEERVIPMQIEREAGPPRPGQTRVIPMQVEGQQQQMQQRRPGPVYVHNKYSSPQSPDLAAGVDNMNLADPGTPIQSRSFRVLQKITNTDEEPGGGGQGQWMNETGPGGQHPKLELTDEDRDLMNKFKSQVNDETYLHTESDPRYRGAYIPSRAFRILQTMTDSGDEVEMPRGPPVRGGPSQRAPGMSQGDQTGPYVPPSEQQVAEPKKYTGGSIPSRSFRMLQAMTAPNQVGPGESDM